jgi:TPR repeat protein
MVEDPGRGRGTDGPALLELRQAADRGEQGAALRLGDLLRQEGDSEGAEQAYMVAVKHGEPGAWVRLGDLKRGVDNETSANAYRRALDGGEIEAAVRLGDVLTVEGQVAEAELVYRRAFEGGDPEGRTRLGDLLASLGRYEDASKLYEEGLSRGEYEMAVRLGDVLLQMGDVAQAEAVYRRAVDRGDPEANTRIGDLLRDQGRLEEAIASYERGALTGDPDAATRVTQTRGVQLRIPEFEPPDEPLRSQSDWRSRRGELGWVHDCAFHPGGELLALAGGSGLQTWTEQSGGWGGEAIYSTDTMWACAFSPDGRLLAGAGEEGLSVFYLGGRAPASEISTVAGEFTACAFSPDGRLAAVGEDGLVMFETVEEIAAPHTILARGGTGGCAFSPDGRLLARVGAEGIELWDRREKTTLLPTESEGRGDCAFSPDGHFLASTGDGLRLWRIHTSGAGLLWHDVGAGGLGGCAFSPDGRWLANGGDDGLWLWEVSQGSTRRARRIDGGRTNGGCAFSPDGRLVAGAGQDGLWIGGYGAVVEPQEPTRSVSSSGPEAPAGSLPGMTSDVADGDDLLDIGADVRAIANVVAARSLSPPLSIGLFGDWGSGKSFFIREVQRRVRALATASRDTVDSAYCGYVRNVTFNAWHYADANLWASLVTHIFDELGQHEPDSGVADRATAAAQLARLELELAENSALKDRLERARNLRREVEARRNLIRLVWRVTGSKDEQSLGEIGDDLQSIRSARRLLLRGRAWLLLAMVALLMASAVFGLVLLFGGQLLLQTTLAGLAALAAPLAVLQTLRQRALGMLKHAGAAAREIDVGRTEVDAELDVASAAEQRLQEELSDLAAGRRLARVAVERSGDYREHLGLVSRIHDDFMRMSELLIERRAAPDELGAGQESDLPSIDRIVLYIDDLDRCPPRRVMQVLEAVHLILAVPLFVVVVAVDPRWLLQSLKLHNTTMLDVDTGVGEQAAEGDGWGASPIDYLEKIIQVPFTLRPMNKDSVGSLIRGLMADRGQSDGEESTRTASETAPADAAHTQVQGTTEAPVADALAEFPAEQTAPANLPSPDPRASIAESQPEADRESAPSRKIASFAAAESLSSRPVVLTQAEMAFAANVATGLHTPRTVKKFTNLYRLLRAGLDEEQLNRFLAERGSEASEYMAVLILLAAIIARPEDASGFLIELVNRIDSDTAWQNLLLSPGLYQVSDSMRDFLAGITPSGSGDWVCAPFKRWAPEVSRYSFRTGQEVFARVGVQQAEEA